MASAVDGPLSADSPTVTVSQDRASGRHRFVWAFLTPVIAVLVALIPLAFNARYYFYDDTQIGAYPIWFEIGSQLRDGVWPVFSTEGWQAGNYAAEGQWGIFSVLTMLIGITSTVVPDAVLFATAVKLAFLALASGGMYLVARSYAVIPPFAFAAGVSIVLAGFTVYLDSPSWVTGLMVWSLLPWLWWALRRMVLRDASPILPVFAGYLLVSVGYVHGTIMLVLLFIAVIAETVFTRRWRQLLRIVGVGVIMGLIALAVYLPGVLTLSSTSRTTIIDNTDFFTLDLTGLAGSSLATASPQVSSPWWGPFAPAPLTYIAWFLPLLVLIDFNGLRRVLSTRMAVPIFLLLSIGLCLAPSDLGPLRTPVRLMPYVSLSVILLFFIAFSLARLQRVSRSRMLVLALVFLGSAYLGWTGDPATWQISGLVCAVMSLGFIGVVTLLNNKRTSGTGLPFIAVGLVLVSVAVAVPQHRLFPNPPVQDFLLPSDVQAYQAPLAEAKGQTMIVGAPSSLGDAAWDESLVGNSWYLNDHPVHNLYSPTQNKSYSEDLCMSSRGETCPELAQTIFEEDQTTGKPLADLLRIDSLQLVRSPEQQLADLRAVPPSGWSLAESDRNSVLWTRDETLSDVGAPVWASAGTLISLDSNTNDEVRFTVDEVPAGGGDISLSRIDWPGYTAENATITESLRGYLLTVHVDGASAGSTVTVRFDPPGWPIELGALVLALIGTLVWGGTDLVRRLRRHDGVARASARRGPA